VRPLPEPHPALPAAADGAADAVPARDAARPAGGVPLDELVPQLYGELRLIARRQRRRERADHTLDTTAVIHEAYLRLAGQRCVRWEDRARFLAAAAGMMRRVLVDHARRRRTAKRGAAPVHVSLDERAGVVDVRDETLLALDDALARLATLDARLARVVECRFFGGLTEPETAAALGVTDRTVRRDWTKARGWLYAALGADDA
jgi:RNA polymerase sigma factor (TIGR02999 family)